MSVESKAVSSLPATEQTRPVAPPPPWRRGGERAGARGVGRGGAGPPRTRAHGHAHARTYSCAYARTLTHVSAFPPSLPPRGRARSGGGCAWKPRRRLRPEGASPARGLASGHPSSGGVLGQGHGSPLRGGQLRKCLVYGVASTSKGREAPRLRGTGRLSRPLGLAPAPLGPDDARRLTGHTF